MKKGGDNSVYACRARETLINFLKMHHIDYNENEGRIEFKRIFSYKVIFVNGETILCDDKMNLLLKSSVFEVIQYISQSVNLFV